MTVASIESLYSMGQVIKELEDGLEAWHEKDRWAEVGIREHLADKSFNWALS